MTTNVRLTKRDKFLGLPHMSMVETPPKCDACGRNCSRKLDTYEILQFRHLLNIWDAPLTREFIDHAHFSQLYSNVFQLGNNKQLSWKSVELTFDSKQLLLDCVITFWFGTINSWGTSDLALCSTYCRNDYVQQAAASGFRIGRGCSSTFLIGRRQHETQSK